MRIRSGFGNFIHVLVAFSLFVPSVLFAQVGDEVLLAYEQEQVYKGTRELIVQLRPRHEPFDSAVAGFRSQILGKFGKEFNSLDANLDVIPLYGDGYVKLQVPEGADALVIAKRLKFFSGIGVIEPNYPVVPLMIPNDTYFDKYQWNLKLVHADAAWDVSTGAGVTVAVLDSGIAYETSGSYMKSPDFGKTLFTAGYDFINRDALPYDDYGHGTHIAGILAASFNDRYGIAGGAPGVTLMPVKILSKNGGGGVAELAEGIRWAADHGARVINMSVGTSDKSDILTQALSYAYGKGAVLIAAVGNDGSQKLLYPAAERDYVVAVGASDVFGNRASYSNMGDSIDLIAPGGILNQDTNNDGQPDGILSFTYERLGNLVNTRKLVYSFAQGTSVAAPHVSAAAALIIAKGINDPAQVRLLLQRSADDKGITGWDNETGSGLLNMERAVIMAGNTTASSFAAVGSESTIKRSSDGNTPTTSSSPAGTSPAQESNPPAQNNDSVTVAPSDVSTSSHEPSTVQSLTSSIKFYNRFGKETSRFTWWDQIYARVTVKDQEGNLLPGALVEIRYRVKGGSDMGFETKYTNTSGMAEFIIGPFKRNSIIELGVVAGYETLYSPLITSSLNIR